MAEANTLNKKRLIGARWNYYGRVVTYVLFCSALFPHLLEIGASTPILIYVVMYFLLFPHIAFLIAKNDKNPSEAEKRNVLVESFCEGNLYTFASFSLLPFFMIFCVGIMYKYFFGGGRLLFNSLSANIFGVITAGLVVGFNIDLATSYPSNFISSGVLIICVIALAVFIKSDSDRSRSKIRNNKRQLEDLSNKLSKYLSPQVYDRIVLGNEEVKLTTYEKHLTIFFSRIKGFSKLTESMESESLLASLNIYFNEMSIVASKYNCTIDKFIGPTIMIFFGDPTSDGKDQDTISCVNMAIEMQNRLDDLRREWLEEGSVRNIHVGIGIGKGNCIVGNFGSEERLDYTIIGRKVNDAHKLVLQSGDDEILITKEVYETIKGKVRCESIDNSALPDTYVVTKNSVDQIKEDWTYDHGGVTITTDGSHSNPSYLIQSLNESIESLEQLEI